MANIKASKKDIRKTAKRQVQNAQQRARLRTFDKKIRALLEDNKLEEAKASFITFSSYLDRAGKRNLIHPKKADRKKSRIALLINKSAGAKKA